MIEKEVLGSLLDPKKISVLKALYFAKEEMYLREIAKKSGVSTASVFRILWELTRVGLVRVKEIGMMKFFSLVKDGRNRFLDEWFKEEGLLDTFLEEVKGTEGLKRVFLQGKIENNHANVILIGKGIDELNVERICNKMKEKGVDLSHVVLTEEQFEKLDRMGIYAEKKVLL